MIELAGNSAWPLQLNLAMPLRCLIGYALDVDDRQRFVQGCIARARIRLVDRPVQLKSALVDSSVTDLVFDASRLIDGSVSIIEEWATSAPHAICLARASLSRSVIPQLISFSRKGLLTGISIKGFDDLLTDYDLAVNQSQEASLRATLLDRLASRIPASVADIVFAALLIGHRRRRVRELSMVTGIPLRTLEWRLRAAGVTSAAGLLGVALCLHFALRLELSTWTLKRVVKEAGFSDTQSCLRFVRRHLERHSKEAGSYPSFDGCVARFGELVNLQRTFNGVPGADLIGG